MCQLRVPCAKPSTNCSYTATKGRWFESKGSSIFGARILLMSSISPKLQNRSCVILHKLHKQILRTRKRIAGLGSLARTPAGGSLGRGGAAASADSDREGRCRCAPGSEGDSPRQSFSLPTIGIESSRARIDGEGEAVAEGDTRITREKTLRI